MSISPSNSYMTPDQEFIYDDDEEEGFLGLFCPECDREWGNMPICPSCGNGAESRNIDSDVEEILRMYVKYGQSSYFTEELLNQLLDEQSK